MGSRQEFETDFERATIEHRCGLLYHFRALTRSMMPRALVAVTDTRYSIGLTSVFLLGVFVFAGQDEALPQETHGLSLNFYARELLPNGLGESLLIFAKIVFQILRELAHLL